MFNKVGILILINFFLFFLGCNQKIAEIDRFDNMPILEETPAVIWGNTPIAERSLEYRSFLSASVRIKVRGATGSGTIIYYDKIKKLAYIASCGHLWSEGIVDSEYAKKLNAQCVVTTWYHNDIKLKEPKSYNARVLFYSNIIGQDTSLLVFSPDWEPDYFPIAPKDYRYTKDSFLHSCGSDGGSESAHYFVNVYGLDRDHLITYNNSPRPGRSGGGLMDDKGYYVGTCCRTQYRDGTGFGYFGTLESIHNFWSRQKGYEFLLNQNVVLKAREIQIVDRNKKQGKYEESYILVPSGRF
jgi:hypothetical protein